MRRSRWSIQRLSLVAAGAAAAGMLGACGGGARQDAAESTGHYPVAVTASFPSAQRLSEHSHLIVRVRNDGSKTIPNVAVTVTDPPWGTEVQAFGAKFNQPDVAYRARAVWIVDRPPGPCTYSCTGGNFGSAATAYANTWALGALRPGATAVFDWGLTAVQRGSYAVAYRVSAGLNGKARAELAGGGVPGGRFEVRISGAPAQAYVDNHGKIVNPAGATPLPSGGASPDAPAGASSG